MNLPDGNGFDICREMKERCPDTAVIFQRKDAALLKRIVTQSGGDYHSSFQSHSLYWGTADQQSIQEVLRQVEEDNKENTKDEWKAGRFENAK